MEKNNSEIIIYQTEDGATKINVRLDGNSVWLTQSDLVELFQSSKSNISEHIKHIFEEGELNETAVVRKFRTTAPTVIGRHNTDCRQVNVINGIMSPEFTCDLLLPRLMSDAIEV